MKAFDPIAAGFVQDKKNVDVYERHESKELVFMAFRCGDSWRIDIGKGEQRWGREWSDFHVPFAKPFNHRAVVALLRANGADIPEASDE